MAEDAKKDDAATDDKKEVDTSSLSSDAKKLLESVEKMSVLELAELVKVMEDKFGVSAAAPVAMAAAAPGAGGGEDEGDGKVNVELTNTGGTKIAVIKLLREITGLGLKEAKEIADSAPKVFKEGVEKDEAEKIKTQLEEAGAVVEFK